MGEELLRVPRVFARDQISFLEHAERSKRDVFQVADGSGNEIELAWLAARVGAVGHAFRRQSSTHAGCER